MELAYHTDEQNGVTLVEFQLHNPTRTAREVRIESTLDAPILPPRHRGYPVSGWDDEGWCGTIAAGADVSLGFASRATGGEPPVEVVRAEPVDTRRTERSAEDVVQALGDPRPPQAATNSRSQPSSVSTVGDAGTDQQGVQQPSRSVPPILAAWFDRLETRIADGDDINIGAVRAVANRAGDLTDAYCQ